MTKIKIRSMDHVYKMYIMKQSGYFIDIVDMGFQG